MAGLVGPAEPAGAATTILTVTTVNDSSASSPECTTSTTAIPSPLSLRNALCLADNYGGVVIVQVPSGTYTLGSGELVAGSVPGLQLTIQGSGAASTIIDGNGSGRVLDLDPSLSGGVAATVNAVTIRNGSDSGFGGAGIIAGSGTTVPPDSLTINDSIVTGNHANNTTPTSTNNPGGGLQFIGGTLAISNTTFSNNTSQSSPGSAIAYQATGAAGGESFSLTGSTISGNALTNAAGTGVVNGGAVDIAGPVASTVSRVTFSGNMAAGTAGPVRGAALRLQNGTLTLSDSTFVNNVVTGSGTGAAVEAAAGSATLRRNRIVGNTASGGFAVNRTAGTVDAQRNWWGCNAGPGFAGCDTAAAGVTTSPRLVLTATAPAAISAGAATGVTGDLTHDSAGAAVPGPFPALDGVTLGFGSLLPAGATCVPGSVILTGGSATGGCTYAPNGHSGAGRVVLQADSQAVTAAITVTEPAAVVTDPADTTVLAGATATFTAAASGYPAPTVQWQRKVGAGSFTDIGGATTTTLSFTASGSDDGTQYRAHFVNSTGDVVTAPATLTVHQPPAFSSAATTAFTVGTPGSYDVTTTGRPDVTSITATGALPAGLAYADHHDGTAKISGTPQAGTGGVSSVHLVATNGVDPDAAQDLAITVNEAPAVTAAPHDAVVGPGDPVSFNAAASGYPVPSVKWQVSTDAGGSWADVPSATSATYSFTTTRADDGNRYRAVFSNGGGSVTTDPATLTIRLAPAITSANATTFTAGVAGTFTVTTDAIPDATVGTTTTLPAWLTLTPGAAGTATLSGTAPAGSGGSYVLALTAGNGVDPAAAQSFTLTVQEAPHIDSAPAATFVVGSATSFVVTTDRGYPVPALTLSGSLPSGLGFTDNGDGTATISGTALPGTGGQYALDLTAANGVGADDAQAFTLTVREPRSITSADHATFVTGTSGTFTVRTAGGYPTATTLSESGALPNGVRFVDNHDGTAKLAGTPAAGSDGTYPLVITADNTVGAGTTQAFTLTVTARPRITSADHATFTAGTAGSFDVTTDPGFPATTALSVTGSLPSGVTFTDLGDGTGTLAGAPGDGSGGTYPLTVTASNATGDSTQSFTLTVVKAATITSADHATLRVGVAGSRTVTTTAGFPTATTLTASGALPAGVTFTDNGDGTATLGGTPATGTGGTYPLTLTADNGVQPDGTQAFTLTVEEAAAVTSAAVTTFGAGVASTFTVTTHGFPVPALSRTGTLPGGVTFVDNHDGTATLAGTPAEGTTGDWPITLTAANGIGTDATQAFTLTVSSTPQAITFTSTPPASGVVGQRYAIAATGGASGNPVTFSIDASATATCSISGAAVTFEHPGTCLIDAHQDGNAQYAPADATQSVPVTKASTTTTVTVAATTVAAAVAPVAPGAGAPSGVVTFSVDGHPVGTAPLIGATATLTYRVPAGHAHGVAAVYGGDPDFAGSAGSTARHDPAITATVSSRTPRTHFGWYRSPVTVTFRCATAGAPLTAPCPAPVTFARSAAGQSVTRTITAIDGGVDSVTVKGINVDRVRPTVSIRGVRSGAYYAGAAPAATCVGRDALAGLAACRLVRSASGPRVTVTATAADRAGNTATTRLTYVVLPYFVQGAPVRDGAFVLHEGHTYTIVALTPSTVRPRLYDAAPAGRTPGPADELLRRAGTQYGQYRYTIDVHVDRGLGRYEYWNLGIKVGATMHLVRFHPVR